MFPPHYSGAPNPPQQPCSSFPPPPLHRWRGLPLTSRVLVESVDLLPSHLSHLTREVVVVGREGEEVARDTGAQPSLWPAGCAMAAGDRLLQVWVHS